MSVRTIAGEELAPGTARPTGAQSACHNAPVWIVPWYTVTPRGVRWWTNVRLCEVCGEDR